MNDLDWIDLGEACKEVYTYYKPLLQQKSHIDQVLVRHVVLGITWTDAVVLPHNDPKNASNSSYHTPISTIAKFPMSVKECKQSKGSATQMFEWDKMDVCRYGQVIELLCYQDKFKNIQPKAALLVLHHLIATATAASITVKTNLRATSRI